jgi:hypothetical protein
MTVFHGSNAGFGMETMNNTYVYKGDDISFIVLLQIEQTVSILARQEKRAFDEVYTEFLESNAYSAIQEPRSLMWYENAEFIADEYYREKSGPKEGQ